MSRKGMLAIVAGYAMIALPALSPAAELISATETITEIGDTFSFNFTGDPDLASVQVTDTLLGVRVDWLFVPGAAMGNETMMLRAKLSLADAQTGVGFDSQVSGSLASTPAYAETNSASLTLSEAVLDGLLTGTYGVLPGALRVLAPNIPDMVSFFDAGGSLQSTLTLITNPNGGPGGGGDPTEPVPEPASMLIWGVIGAGGLLYRRRRLRAA